MEQKELAVREAEIQLVQRTEGVRQQYGDFLKNRSALDADKVTFERQKYLWEREKAALLQNVQVQRAAAIQSAETSTASRPVSSTSASAVSSVETKQSTASISADEQLVSQIIGGSQEGLIASRSSPSLSAADSGE